MPHPLTLKAGSQLIPFRDIKEIDMADLDDQSVVITTYLGDQYVAQGFDAIEALYALKPSSMEGRRGLRWAPHAWAFHNLVGHPVTQLLAWVGLKKHAIWFHDITTPKPRDFR